MPNSLLIPQFAAGGTESMFLFFTGAIDVAYVGLTPYLLGRSYGLPIRIIGVAQQFDTSHGVTLLPERANGQRGRLKIGTKLGSTGHFVGYQWAKASGTEVTFVYLSPEDQREAMECGFVDGIAAWEPHLTFSEKQGARRVFSSRDAPAPCFNLICATEAAIRRVPGLVTNFLEGHRRAVKEITSSGDSDYLEYLEAVFDHRLSAGEHDVILRNCYLWPDSEFIEAPGEDTPITRSLLASHEFLVDTRLVGGEPLDLRTCFPEDDHRTDRMEADRLTVAYSDSLMCGPFHVAVRRGIFEEIGFSISHEERRLVERIARLGEEYRTDFKVIKELISRDPDLAVMKIGQISEHLFSRIYADTFGTEPLKSLDAVLGELQSKSVAPVVVLTSAHWIREVRNVATHEKGVTRAQAEKACVLLVDNLEWYQERRGTIGRRCARCSKPFEEGWKNCPYCGVSLDPACGNCGGAVKAAWKTCPHCGDKL